jgi:predicted metal-dependent hydrolase
MPTTHRVLFGQTAIDFALAFNGRPTLSITVHPDKRVEVVAPEGESLEAVLDRVRRRGSWILRQLDAFDRLHPLTPPRRYVGGETHLYLGRQYRLQLTAATDDEVKLVGKHLHVRTADRGNAERVKELLDDWYRRHAQAVFARRMEVCHTAAAGVLGIERPGFQLRQMTKRWGSCTAAGRVLLNPELVKTPVACIDYVITHELCHLKVMSHGPGFSRVLGRCMPDWQRRKERLDAVAV